MQSSAMYSGAAEGSSHRQRQKRVSISLAAWWFRLEMVSSREPPLGFFRSALPRVVVVLEEESVVRPRAAGILAVFCYL